MGAVFAKIKPLLEAKDDTLKKGEMSVDGTVGQDTWIDNFIVGETEADFTFPVEGQKARKEERGKVRKF